MHWCSAVAQISATSTDDASDSDRVLAGLGKYAAVAKLQVSGNAA